MDITEKKRARRRWFLLTIVAAVLVLALLIGVFAYLMFPTDQWRLVPNLTSDHSNIAARGMVTEIHQNYTSYGLGSPHVMPYHVFPAVIVVNMTQILWTADDVNGSLAYWKSPHSLGVQFRDVPLAYDASDIPELAVGQAVEFSGFYEGITDTVNSFFITISPNINSSYLKIANFPLPDSAAPAPHYLTYYPNATRIFLVSSSARFSSYPQNINPSNPSLPDMHRGDPCIIITATVRNDYSAENPPPGGFATYDSHNYSLILLSTRLYDKNGHVSAWDVTPGYEQTLHDTVTYGIGPGETLTVNIFLGTSNMGIDRYEIFLGYLGNAPIP